MAAAFCYKDTGCEIRDTGCAMHPRESGLTDFANYVSRIPYPASRISYPVSRIPHPASASHPIANFTLKFIHMIQRVLPAWLLFFSLYANSQTDSSIVKLINPSSVSAPKGYSHVAEIDLGNCTMLIISGQVALDQQGNLVGKDDVAKQTEQVFINLRNCIANSGGTMDNIVKSGYYMRDVSQIQKVRDVRDKFINTGKPPASTLVEVSKLFREDILIEIEATVIIPKVKIQK
jgi:enamine deaminase RidA (YjgF/YER057c/UK114 family)